MSGATSMKLKDPNGKVRKIRYVVVPPTLRVDACVRTGLFRREWASAWTVPGAVRRLAERLEGEGWEVVS